MKRYIRILFFVLFMIGVVSCNNETTDSVEYEQTSNTSPHSLDSVYNHIREQDSLFMAAIDTLNKQLESHSECIDNFNNYIKEHKSDKRSTTWVYIFFFLFVSVLFVFLYWEIRELKTFRKKTVHTISKIKSSLNNHSQSSRSNMDCYDVQLVRRVEQLENKVATLTAFVNTIQIPEVVRQNKKGNISQPSSELNTLYANLNQGKHFIDVVGSNQESCVYRIELTSKDEGLFSLISLEKIRSSNGWEDVIDYSGCSVETAIRYKTEDKGKCEKVPGMENVWKVTKNLKIRFE